ncbi:MAG: SUMF1/EgtB/PvdO family nonheme iron enzyme [bacterium]
MSLNPLEGVSEGMAMMLSERIFGEVGKSGKYQMIERTQAERVLKENRLAMVCADTTRAVEAGKLLAAEFIVIGSVGRLGEMYTVNTRLVSVESGAVVDMVTTDHEGQDGLLFVVVINARQLMKLPPIPVSEMERAAGSQSGAAKGPKGKVPPSMPVLSNGGKIELVWIPDGDLVSESDDHRAMRRVIPMQGFWIGKYEVTQDQWVTLMGKNPARFKGGQNPVDGVSWDEAREFCGKLETLMNTLSATNQETRLKVRLPSEREWEYACRAGEKAKFNTGGNDEKDLMAAGWYEKNGGGTTHPVGTKQPNAWGLCDMHGNVAEWCDNRMGTSSHRVVKGGSYDSAAEECAVSVRDDRRQGRRDRTVGVRIVVSSF